jgi:uncharacterized protein
LRGTARHRRHGDRFVSGPVKTGFGEAAGISDEEAEAALPRVMWKTADEVARAGIDGLAAGKGVVAGPRQSRDVTV